MCEGPGYEATMIIDNRTCSIIYAMITQAPPHEATLWEGHGKTEYVAHVQTVSPLSCGHSRKGRGGGERFGSTRLRGTLCTACFVVHPRNTSHHKGVD